MMIQMQCGGSSRLVSPQLGKKVLCGTVSLVALQWEFTDFHQLGKMHIQAYAFYFFLYGMFYFFNKRNWVLESLHVNNDNDDDDDNDNDNEDNDNTISEVFVRVLNEQFLGIIISTLVPMGMIYVQLEENDKAPQTIFSIMLFGSIHVLLLCWEITCQSHHVLLAFYSSIEIPKHNYYHDFSINLHDTKSNNTKIYLEEKLVQVLIQA
ncbi:hypothetical protein ACFE04_013816 [Oxalis oulophora]